MVNPVFDHIVAILIIGVIFVGAVVILPTLSLTSLQAVDQQQMRNTALNVFNTMLLDEGQPSNWGALSRFQINDDRVKRFGLSEAQEPTFYVLDPDKVQRLVQSNPMNYCKYEYVKGLLALPDYGFKLRIIPPFNATFDGPLVPVGTLLRYQIKVTYLAGDPIPNAKTEATVTYTSKTGGFGITQAIATFTNAVGIATGNVTLNFVPDRWVVTARVTVSDVATLVVISSKTGPNTIADINLVYDQMILTRTKYSNESNENVWINNIVAYDSQGTVWSLYNSTVKNPQDHKLNTGSFEMWKQTFFGLHGFNPVVLIFNFWAEDKSTGNGRQFCLVVMAYPNLLGTNVFEYGGTPSTGEPVVKIQRSVVVAKMTYTAELWLWKT